MFMPGREHLNPRALQKQGQSLGPKGHHNRPKPFQIIDIVVFNMR